MSCINLTCSLERLCSPSRVMLPPPGLSWWWEKHLWTQLEMHSVWSKLEFNGRGRQTVCGYVITSPNFNYHAVKERWSAVIDLTASSPQLLLSVSKSAHPLLPETPEAKFCQSFHHYTIQMATGVIIPEHLSRLGSQRAVTALGPEPCQWQSKSRQDITDLQPQAIYENPSETLSVSKLHEWVCNSSHTLHLWCSLTSRSLHHPKKHKGWQQTTTQLAGD